MKKDNSFAKQTDTCHAELVWQREQAQRSELCDPVPSGAASCNRHGDKTLKRVQGDKVAFNLAEVFHPAEQSKRIASRIIRAVAGVTSRSNSRAGFAIAHTAPYRKFGFTLAEVLITLGIIGVVAALTMPSLIAKHQEKETSVKLKKVYTTVSQAMNMAVAEHGTFDQWGLTHTVQDTNDKGELVTDESGIENLTAIFSKYLKGEPLQVGWNKDLDLKNMQKVSLTVADGMINYAPTDRKAPTAIKLHDGTILIFGAINYNPSCANDNFKNGDYCSAFTAYFPNKQEQVIQGVNYFSFYIMKNKIIPWGTKDDFHNPFDRGCKLTINNRASGRGCTAWVIYNENMDYLHCNDLSWDGKHKCK